MPAIPLHRTLADARDRLVRAGVEPPEAAAAVELFARAILGWDRAHLVAARTAPTPAALEPTFSAWVARRARHEPAAYIVGVREFWGREFRVTPAVLIPRPETEIVVEEALRVVAEFAPAPDYRARIADIGTGSGCIAVTLAAELPSSRVVATDISADALAVAQENAERHGVADRIEFVNTSYLGAVEGELDLIAANPPYIRQQDLETLPAEVRHEPHTALGGGDTGLRDIEGILETADAKLRKHGWLVMEFGFGQQEDIRSLTARHPALSLERIRPDLQGIPRVAAIRHR